MANQVEPQVGQREVTNDPLEKRLWTIRHWHADVSLNTGALLTALTVSVSKLITEQEASLIELLRSRDRGVAHLVYADWLDDNGLATAAIAHRLAGERFEWRKVGSQLCFVRSHIFGMHNEWPPFLPTDERDLIRPIMTWLVPVAEADGAKMPHAEYAGSFNFQTAVLKIYEVSWQLRHYIPNQKESSA